MIILKVKFRYKVKNSILKKLEKIFDKNVKEGRGYITNHVWFINVICLFF